MWSIIAAIIAAFLSSYLTTIFASRRYRDERVWDRKAAAYAEVISGIKKSIRYSETFKDTYDAKGGNDSDSIINELLEQSQAAKRNVEAIYDNQFIFLSELARKK